MTIHFPPRTTSHAGDTRRVGVEFEMAEIAPQAIAECVIARFGGNIELHHNVHICIKETSLGDFTVELDSHYIKKLSERAAENPASGWLEQQVHSAIIHASEQVVPYELVTPPVPLDQLSSISQLLDDMRNQGAKGSKDSLIYGFGTHYNPEVADTDVSYILRVLRAFLVLYPWLKHVMEIDISRRLMSFIDPFKPDYMLHVLDSNYTPDEATFCTDYIRFNQTRNRALDMTPLIAYLNRDYISALSPRQQQLVNARPTFHYRLPDCNIGLPEWDMLRDWNYWVRVETLAEDEDALLKLCQEYRKYLQDPLQFSDTKWVQHIQHFMDQAS